MKLDLMKEREEDEEAMRQTRDRLQTWQLQIQKRGCETCSEQCVT